MGRTSNGVCGKYSPISPPRCPRFSSPAARLLALQCALRADTSVYIRLPGGLLRGMRLCGRRELWEQLEHADWLRRTACRYPHVEAQLRDAAVFAQRRGRRVRARAAHWALRPVPLVLPGGWAPAVQLTAVVLATSTSGAAGSTDMEVLARLCGHSPHQAEELLDRLVASHSLAAWHYCRDTEEVAWRLSLQVRVGRAAVQQ
jgi:hypothetical protein